MMTTHRVPVVCRLGAELPAVVQYSCTRRNGHGDLEPYKVQVLGDLMLVKGIRVVVVERVKNLMVNRAKQLSYLNSIHLNYSMISKPISV